MKQQATESTFGRQSRFMVIAAAVGALTFISGLWLGAFSAAAPGMGEAEAILMAQPATDAVASRAAFEISYAAKEAP
jgi:hypothetical protein